MYLYKNIPESFVNQVFIGFPEVENLMLLVPLTAHIISVLDFGKPSISDSIRSIKMCS